MNCRDSARLLTCLRYAKGAANVATCDLYATSRPLPLLVLRERFGVGGKVEEPAGMERGVEREGVHAARDHAVTKDIVNIRPSRKPDSLPAIKTRMERDKPVIGVNGIGTPPELAQFHPSSRLRVTSSCLTGHIKN